VRGQTSAFLDKPQELLNQAGRILEVGGLTEAASRTAYLAGFHAAQAFSFESIGRIYKAHSGMRSEFSRLLKDDPRVDDQLRSFLAMAYNLKEIADYETGPSSHVSDDRARLTVEAARRFVARITELLA
jgi:uncharacterized protein (UPF0332 family)